MVTATHAFHVHTIAVVLSRYSAARSGLGFRTWDRHRRGPEGVPPANRNSSALVAYCPGRFVDHGRSDTAAQCDSVCDYTIPVTWWCQWVFSGGRPKNYRSWDPRQVVVVRDRESSRASDERDSLELADTKLENGRAPGVEKPPKCGDNGAIGSHSTQAAIQRRARLMQPDFRHQFAQIMRRDIRWIAQNKIELAVYRISPIATEERTTIGEAQVMRVLRGQTRGLLGEVDANSESARPLMQQGEQQASGAGA
jgi:hypothetical protein